MSYLALARKWRPRTFSQLVGQEHITKALLNSLNQERLHHAYLFSGTRGVGKTSVARLLAKALNCEQRVNAEPCLECDNCLAIEQGRFIDLIEIDGASKTRVEDTRELLENVQYSPTNAKFKIYLIDEVHMLSQHSFNALLKTLEEPPEHVKFLLATTEPQKLPVTVLSRCLQFNLKHLAPSLIAAHLVEILGKEQIHFEKEAIDILANAAKGSMRDALSLLDQTIASIEQQLTAAEVKMVLGYTREDYALQLVLALNESKAEDLISISRNIANEGGHFRYVLETVLDYFHQINITQSLSEESPFISLKDEIKLLAKTMTAEDVQLFYQIGIKGLDEMHLAPTLAIGFEMTLLRMLSFKPVSSLSTPPLAYQEPKKEQNKQSIETKPVAISPSILSKEEVMPKDSAPAPLPIEKLAEVLTDEPIIEPPSNRNEDWGFIVSQLKLSGFTLNAAENAELVSQSEKNIALRVAQGHSSLFTPSVITRLEEALTNYYKRTIKLSINIDSAVETTPAQQRQISTNLRLQNAENHLNEDPFFQQLKQEFSAELVKNSIDSVEDGL